jgi:diguanylate cyclase (GGDEF)-like protein/PAS domain S-box-containing protein
VLYRRSGRPLWVELSLAPASDAAGGAHVVATGRDVTARRLAERRALQLEAAVEGSLDGIAIVDAFHDLRYVNDAFALLHGHDRTAPMLGTSWRALYDEAELARFDVDVLPHLDAGDRWRGESIARRIDGATFPQELSITSLAGGSFVCVVRDITERRESEEALRRVSLEDALTGLWNRRGFLMLAQQALTAARRSGACAHLLYLDLDSFKPINDTHGHAVGDEALAEVAEVLRETFRESDLIGRLGGDEFVVLATNCVDGSGEVLLRRLDERLAERNARAGRRYGLAISRGLARFDAGAPVSLDELMLEADRRLYEEKREKRGSRA